jgi:hypothetical protein
MQLHFTCDISSCLSAVMGSFCVISLLVTTGLPELIDFCMYAKIVVPVDVNIPVKF